jgi:hypothetical protein
MQAQNMNLIFDLVRFRIHTHVTYIRMNLYYYILINKSINFFFHV